MAAGGDRIVGMPTVERVPKLEVHNLYHAYRLRDSEVLVVLDRITFTIQEGEFVSFVGPSGCGKTTLLRILNGLVQPTGGEIRINGKPSHLNRAEVATVFQHDSLLPWRNVVSNISFGLELKRARRGEIQRAVDELIGLVGLEGFARSYPHELSGGMRQRVNLARAYAVDPQILLMDEPFGSLDAQTRELMQQELLRIWQERRKTVVFVTHQIEEAVYLSDRVFLMTPRPGRIREEVPVDLPRPRDLGEKRSTVFHRLVDRLSETLQEEAISATSRRDDLQDAQRAVERDLRGNGE